MPRGLRWRLYLLAFLLSAGQADNNSDLKEGSHDRDTRSGYLHDSNESNADTDALADAFENYNIPYSDDFEDNHWNNVVNNKLIYEQEKIDGFLPGPSVSSGHDNQLVEMNENEYLHTHFDDVKEKSVLKGQYIQQKIPGGLVLHDELMYPKDPSYVTHVLENEYPLRLENKDVSIKSGYHPEHRLISKIIPLEEHILLHNIPGASNVIKCSKEGELHNFWAPGLQCMVCVCLSAYGQLRPACVSCQTCMVPPAPPTSNPTTSEPDPPVPYTTPSPEEVSCKPLPVNLPFTSPLDPCKICICSETVSPWGIKDVKINCQHNPQCVLPPYLTTSRPQISTPIPLPVCDKFPQNVPFPHPSDPCKICKCSVIQTPFGLPEQQISCYISPECQPDTETPRPEPFTEIPEPITDLPEPEICDRYPDNVLFPHPTDSCQICKCNSNFNLFVTKKKITCYLKPNCIPEPETPSPEPVTDVPELDCDGYPENKLFPHPSDQCQICKCTKDLSLFIPTNRITCYPLPHCLSTPAPWHTSTWTPWPTTLSPVPTPEPQPDNVRCAPLPTGTPFQNPLNPCQICVCTERADAFGRLDVQIECQENPKCAPDVVTPVPLPACKQFPENVPFPHPNDECKMCKCSVVRLPIGIQEEHINCYTKPECLPTPSPEPVTTPEPEPVNLCYHYPLDVFFPHPLDPCRVCICYKNLHNTNIQISCIMKPECAHTPPHTTPSPKSHNATCAPLPSGRPFQNPLNPCQTCVCTEHIDLYGEHDVVIECQDNSQCVLPPDVTTLSPDIIDPIPLPACKQFPENVLFPHPLDACKLCKCAVQIRPYGPPEPVISCVIRPECLPTEPPKPTAEPPGPEPLHLCEKYSDNVIFPNPLDQCKLCKCYRDPRSGFQKQITCFLNPECLSTRKPLPGPTTTPSPEPKTVSCAPLPTGSPFQNPLNPCQICVCTERADLFGRHDVQIECEENPQCVQSPDTPTIPPIVVVPIQMPACKNFPENVLFPHPQDPCQECKCTVQQNQYGYSKEYISCFSKPECLPTQAPTTVTPRPDPESPLPYDICENYPLNIPFEDPNNECRVCTCRHGPDAIDSQIHHSLNRPTLLIQCQTKPECSPMPEPITEEPEAYTFCKYQSMDVPFTDPRDPCQSCVCYLGLLPDTGSGAPILPMQLYKCTLKPECYPPSPEPQTKSPLPDAVSCNPLPTGIPFQNPLNPCQMCVCEETVDKFGRPDVNINCLQNPKCVIPYDVTTVPPTPHTSPIPLPACAQFPTNVIFPHPQEPCKLCKCTVQPMPWGPTEQQISCFTNPECEPAPPGPSTIEPPEPSICERYPANVLFPLPQDHCRLCRCTSKRMPYGDIKQLNCYVNPSCSSTTSTTPAPWPPAPPGPLPGPSPHESCSPYKPNQPFQHPWDECQVCVCREAVSLERISIEVNCYTKPSCCIEPPFDVPGTSSSIVSPVSGGNLIESGSGIVIGSSSGNVNGPTGGNVIGSSSGNLFKPIGEQWLGLSGENVLAPTGGSNIGSSGANFIDPTDENLYKPIIGENFRPIGEKRFGPPGVKYIKPLGGNKITPIGANWNGLPSEISIRPSGGKLIGPLNGNYIDLPGGEFLESSGGNYISSPVEHAFGPTGENVIEPAGQNWIGSTGGNKIESTGGNLIRPNLTPHMRPGGNQYVPNRENILINKRPLSLIRPDLWKESFIRPGQIMGGQIQQHNYLPINIGFPTKSRDTNLGNISPEIGLREGDKSDHRVLLDYAQPEYLGIKTNVKALADGQNANANADTSQSTHYYKGSMKMKTKSGKPSDDSTSEDDEEEIA